MSLAVAKITGRRTNQFGDFMAVLKLCAIDLDAGTSVAEEGLGYGLDYTCLPGAGGAQE